MVVLPTHLNLNLVNLTFLLQVGGFGSKVREVRPLIANAAVHTMGEQAIPRESLTWHLGSVQRAEGKTHLALKQAHAVFLSADTDTLAWAFPEHPLTITPKQEEVKASQLSEPSTPVSPRQVAQVTFASMTSSVVMTQNLSSCSAQKHMIWRRLVPIICIAVVVGVIS